MNFDIRQAGINDIPAIHALVKEATKRGKILKRSRQDIAKAVQRIVTLWPSKEVVGLWVDDRWEVERIG